MNRLYTIAGVITCFLTTQLSNAAIEDRELKKTYPGYCNGNVCKLNSDTAESKINMVVPAGKGLFPVVKMLPDIMFQIQFIALSKSIPLSSKVFSKCGFVNESFVNGMYKYTIGEFKSLLPAQMMLSDIKGMGFKDAFIVAIKDNKRVAVGVAVNMLAH